MKASIATGGSAHLTQTTSRPQRWLTGLSIILTALSTVLLLACRSQESHGGLPFYGDSVVKYPDGTLRKGRLAEVSTIDGLPLKQWIHFHPDGTLGGGKLAEDSLLAGHLLPAGTTLWFDTEGRLENCWLSRDSLLSGVPCNGGPGKIGTYFHPDGSLKTVFLSEDAEIQGVPCRKSLFQPVRFLPNGKLVGCQLSRAFERAGQSYTRGSVLTFDEAGEVTPVRD